MRMSPRTLVVLLLATRTTCLCASRPSRRVNWWFNSMNMTFGARNAAMAAAHRDAITGVYQWIQPNGFWIHPDGSVAFPPDDHVLAATSPLLAAGLESGVVTGLQPGSLESGGALRAVPALVAFAVRFNFTSYIVDLEYPGPVPLGKNASAYCSAAEAHLYADFLTALAAGMHVRFHVCIRVRPSQPNEFSLLERACMR